MPIRFRNALKFRDRNETLRLSTQLNNKFTKKFHRKSLFTKKNLKWTFVFKILPLILITWYINLKLILPYQQYHYELAIEKYTSSLSSFHYPAKPTLSSEYDEEIFRKYISGVIVSPTAGTGTTHSTIDTSSNITSPNPSDTVGTTSSTAIQRSNTRKTNHDIEEKISTTFSRQFYDVCVVGAGLSGAVIAEQYASQLGKRSLIIEKRNHIGGNCYDYIDPETGILVNKYGAHLFHTKHFRVWQYVQRFSEWTPYEHRVLGRIGEKFVPIPVNIDTVNSIFDLNITSTVEMNEWLKKEQVKFKSTPKNSEEMAQARVGKRLYELIFKPYTIKQWGKTPDELGPEVTARIPVRNNWDDRYFDDVFQALPKHGYTKMFENILNNPLIETHVNMDYFEVKDQLNCGHTYFSGPIDHYFSSLGYEKLEYRSLNFERKVARDIGMNKHVLPASVVNFPSADFSFTRIVEYKHFLKQKSNHSVLFHETSNDNGEPYYPVPNDRNIRLFSKYQELAGKEPNVSFVGRLANYKYFNMDESILNALELFDSNAPKVAIMQVFYNDSGGPEALVQLLLAFYSWMPSRTFLIDINWLNYHQKQNWFNRGYAELAEVNTINENDLQAGDVYIIPEIIACPKYLVDRGVRVYIWQLGRNTGNVEEEVTANIKAGCKYTSHNFYCANQDGLHLDHSHIMAPYMRRAKTHFGKLSNNNREDLILVNFDPQEKGTIEIGKLLESYCMQKRRCKVMTLKGFTSDEIKSLYERAKIIVGHCLHGSERSLIEAALSGSLVLLNFCDNGTETRDFPLPREHMYSDRNAIIDIVDKMLRNFEEEQAKLEGFRSLYKSYGPKSLAQDTKRFFFDIMSSDS